MFNRIIRFFLSLFFPAFGTEYLVYWAYAAVAVGTVVTTIDQVNANKARELILEEELRSNELAALDEENRRLIALRLANDEILAGAGGILAFASPSLIAGRAFNFEMGMQDIANIRFNVANVRSQISAKISILRANSRATITAGIFEVAGTALTAQAKFQRFKKPPTTVATGSPPAGSLDLPSSRALNTPGVLLG